MYAHAHIIHLGFLTSLPLHIASLNEKPKIPILHEQFSVRKVIAYGK